MARARNIKPGLFKNEVLGVADPLYTLLFEGLWLLADREGRLEDRPMRIKAEVFPYRDGLDTNAMLDWLERAGFIQRYRHGGQALIQIENFSKHQNPHKNEPESTYSPPEEIGTTSEEIGSTPADSLNLIPDSGFLKPELASDDAGATRVPEKAGGEYPDDFEAAWSLYPPRPGASKAGSFKAWKARRKAGVSPQALIDGVRRYAAYCAACQTEPSYIKQPATFFGPDRHYESDWTPPARASPLNKHAAAARAIYGAPTFPETIDVEATVRQH